MKTSLVVATVLAWMTACTVHSEAADSTVETVFSIKGVHCSVCAKKVATKLKSVPNVKSTNVDAEKGTAVVLAADGEELSPKAAWEAFESAGYKPIKMNGGGTFTSKRTK